MFDSQLLCNDTGSSDLETDSSSTDHEEKRSHLDDHAKMADLTAEIETLAQIVENEEAELDRIAKYYTELIDSEIDAKKKKEIKKKRHAEKNRISAFISRTHHKITTAELKKQVLALKQKIAILEASQSNDTQKILLELNDKVVVLQRENILLEYQADRLQSQLNTCVQDAIADKHKIMELTDVNATLLLTLEQSLKTSGELLAENSRLIIAANSSKTMETSNLPQWPLAPTFLPSGSSRVLPPSALPQLTYTPTATSSTMSLAQALRAQSQNETETGKERKRKFNEINH